MVAYTVLGACAELSGSVVALDDLWGREAVRIQEQLAAEGTERSLVRILLEEVEDEVVYLLGDPPARRLHAAGRAQWPSR